MRCLHSWSAGAGKGPAQTGAWTSMTPGTLSAPFYLILFLLNPSIPEPKVIFLWQSVLFRCSQNRLTGGMGGWVGASLEPDTALHSFHLGLVILHSVNKWQALPYGECKPRHRRPPPPELFPPHRGVFTSTDQPNGKFNYTALKARCENLLAALGLSGSSWIWHSVK